VRYARNVSRDDNSPSDARDVQPSGEPSRADALRGIAPEHLDALASHLVWRVGRLSDDGPIIVRVGLPSAASAFGDLPRLHGASDQELRDAVERGAIRVEWVGGRGRSG